MPMPRAKIESKFTLCHQQPWKWRQYVPLKSWYPPASHYGVTTQNATNNRKVPSPNVDPETLNPDWGSCEFLQSPQANGVISIRSRLILSVSFPIHYPLINLSLDVIVWATSSVVKQTTNEQRDSASHAPHLSCSRQATGVTVATCGRPSQRPNCPWAHSVSYRKYILPLAASKGKCGLNVKLTLVRVSRSRV
jgi:hypothetical protein